MQAGHIEDKALLIHAIDPRVLDVPLHARLHPLLLSLVQTPHKGTRPGVRARWNPKDLPFNTLKKPGPIPAGDVLRRRIVPLFLRFQQFS